MRSTRLYDFFISYRREEYAWESRLLYKTLSSFEKQVYHDVERSPLGEFKKKLKLAYTHSNTILLLVSPTFFDKCSQEGDLIRKGLEHVLSRNKNKSRDYQLIIPICFDPNFVWPENIPASIAEVKDYQWIVSIDPKRMDDGVRQILDKEKEFWKDLRQKKSDVLTLAEYSDYLSRQHKIWSSVIAFLILLTAFLTWFYWPEPLDIKKPVQSWNDAQELVERAVDEEYFKDVEKRENAVLLQDHLRSRKQLTNTLNKSIKCGFDGISTYLVQNAGCDIFSCADGCTPLLEAVRSNNLNMVKFLVEMAGPRKKEYVEFTLIPSFTPLLFALASKNIQIADYLVANGADIFKTFSNPKTGASGTTYLMGVSASGNQEAVQFLIKAAGDRKHEYINAKSSMSESALGFALYAEEMDIAKYLVDNGANIYMPYTDTQRNVDYTYLMMAAILDNLKAVQFLAEAAGTHKEEYINFQASDYETALSMALKSKRMEIAKYLIASGADIFKTNSIIKWGTNITLLMEAASVGNIQSVKCLVEAAGKRKKEYINMEDSTKRTALSAALMSGYIDVARYLVKNGADIFQTYSLPKTGSGYTVLMTVAPLGVMEPVQFLVEAAGNRKREYINAASSDFRTAWGMALGAGQLEIAGYLIENGADIFKTFTNKKITILEDLVSVNRYEAAQFLVHSSKSRKKKLLNHADIYGVNALMYAAKSNAKESVHMLIEEGAEVNHVDFSGKSALDMAEDRQIRKMLLAAGAKSGSQLKKRKSRSF